MSAFAHQKFHRLQHQPGETVLQFVTRLRKERKDCNFGVHFGNQIRDAVLCKCSSHYVILKLLEEREVLPLARTLELAQQCERVEHQMSQISVTVSITVSMKNLGDQRLNKGAKGTRIEKVSVIDVD